MRTFLAFRLENGATQEEIIQGIQRVKSHYYETLPINFEVEEFVVIHKNIGAVIFDSKTTPLKWKSEVSKDNKHLVTFNPPPNWHKFSKSKNVDEAPYELLDVLLANPDAQEEFTIPAAMSIVDKVTDSLSIFTDPLGYARLYEYRGENGWFWSNRPGATTIMANEEAKIDQNAWEFFCASGWFMGSTSPIENVLRVDPGIRIHVTTDEDVPRRIIDHGAFKNMVSPRKLKEYNVKEIAHDMQESIGSYAQLWSIDFKVDLSGGKDSRLNAAAVIASGNTNMTFYTIGNLDQEVITAKELLKIVNLEDKHEISLPPQVRSKKEKQSNSRKVERATREERLMTLFHQSDGDLPPVHARKKIVPSTYFSDIRRIHIQGAMGGVGGSTYYKSEKFYNQILNQGNSAVEDRITKAHRLFGGVKKEVVDRADGMMRAVLQDGRKLGLSKFYLTDYFFLIERSRRWLPQNSNFSKFSVFYSSAYIAQAFHMPFHYKRDWDIFRDLITEFVPEWKDVPFYKKKLTDRDERTEKGLRSWQTSEKDDIENILSKPERWNDIFDQDAVLEIWEKAKLGEFHPGIENLLDRLSMRAVFQDHLDRVNYHFNKYNLENNTKTLFQPYREIENNNEDKIRLVFYDDSTNSFSNIEVLKKNEEYILTEKQLENANTLKYKYQFVDHTGKWKDVTSYVYIN